MPRGQLNLALGLAATYAETGHEEACPDINGPGCAKTPVASEWHALKLAFADVRVHAEYGITDWLAADLLWGLRIVHVGFILQDAATREPIESPFGAEIHHRDETIVGLGDPWLSLRAVKTLGPWAFGFRGGLALPVGSTVENPFALGREGREHEHIQLGTGTVDPFVGVEVQRGIGRFTVVGWMLGKATLYENAHQYRAGSQLMGGFTVTSNLWTKRWAFTLGALGYHEEPETWAGIVETEGNLGRTDVLLDTNLAWQFAGRWSISLGARIPVFSHAVGAQLNTPAIGLLTISRPFDLIRREIPAK